MTRGASVAAAGFGLIAVCYGFARFAFGLLLPRMDADLALSSTATGLISSGSFVAYCLAIVLAVSCTERFGARAVAVLAALVAASGMLGIACAPTATWIAISVFLAGSSTGLASPPLAVAVAASVARARQGAANTFINAGTSAGVVLSGPIALMMGEAWRWAFVIFAAMALAMAWFVFAALPAGAAGRARQSGRGLPGLNRALKRLIFAAFLMGMASTAVWSFGGQAASRHLGLGHTQTSALWIAIGAAGIVGSGAGGWAARYGIRRVHWASLIALAAGILMVDLATHAIVLTAGGVLFGAAYITLTGVYLIWGVAALPERPATGLTFGFVAIASGQAAGAALFGYLANGWAMGAVAIVFAALGLVAGLAGAGRHADLCGLAPPRHRDGRPGAPC